MWRQGSWPSALGLQIAALNVASRFLAGADAAYVLAESDKIIEEARTQDLATSLDGPNGVSWVEGGALTDDPRHTSRYTRTASWRFEGLWK